MCREQKPPGILRFQGDGCLVLTKETGAVWQGGAFAPYKRFAAGKTLAEAEFTSAEHFKFPRIPQKRPHLMGVAFFMVETTGLEPVTSCV